MDPYTRNPQSEARRRFVHGPLQSPKRDLPQWAGALLIISLIVLGTFAVAALGATPV